MVAVTNAPRLNAEMLLLLRSHHLLGAPLTQ
jgi:hypothetical protein